MHVSVSTASTRPRTMQTACPAIQLVRSSVTFHESLCQLRIHPRKQKITSRTESPPRTRVWPESHRSTTATLRSPLRKPRMSTENQNQRDRYSNLRDETEPSQLNQLEHVKSASTRHSSSPTCTPFDLCATSEGTKHTRVPSGTDMRLLRFFS